MIQHTSDIWSDVYLTQLSKMNNAELLAELLYRSQPDNQDDGTHSGRNWKRFKFCEKELRLRLSTWLQQG